MWCRTATGAQNLDSRNGGTLAHVQVPVRRSDVGPLPGVSRGTRPIILKSSSSVGGRASETSISMDVCARPFLPITTTGRRHFTILRASQADPWQTRLLPA